MRVLLIALGWAVGMTLFAWWGMWRRARWLRKRDERRLRERGG